MRRALREELPALSYHFGLKWTDIVDMPRLEVDAYLRALDELTKEVNHRG